jgi:hypothetical protein
LIVGALTRPRHRVSFSRKLDQRTGGHYHRTDFLRWVAAVKRLIFCALALAVSQAFAATATHAPTFDPHRLSDEVKTLSSDAFEGRGPATPAEQKTIAYVVAQMKAAGLQPGGVLVNGKRAWTQAFRCCARRSSARHRCRSTWAANATC